MSKSKTPMVKPKRSNYFLPEVLVDGLNKLATIQGTSAADIVRRSVRSTLRRHKLPVDE